MSHHAAMVRTPLIAVIVAAACGLACLAAPAGAASTASHWSNSHCELQQALFNVRHPHPSGLQLAGGNRILKQHGCAERVPGPKHWSNTQCSNYQATFTKLYASPSNKQLAAANGALKQHGCRQRVQRLPQGY
jgi:hypothetical protein